MVGATLLNVDLAGIVLLVIGLVGMAVLLFRRNSWPPALRILALVELVNLLSVFRMKALFGYHFQVLLVLMVPLTAWVLDRVRARGGGVRVAWAIVVLLMLVLVQQGANLALRNSRDSLQYQNRVMLLVNKLTPPDARVWDGVGFAIHRAPAFDPWFLPAMVRLLVSTGQFQNIRRSECCRIPPRR